MLEVEPSGKRGQRGLMATRSGQNSIESKKIYVVSISKTKRDRAVGSHRLPIITFRVRRSQSEMYIGHGMVCPCVYLSIAAFPALLHGPACNMGEC